VPTVVADLYLARHRVRAEFPTGTFSRLSDFLNSSPGAYLSASAAQISDLLDTGSSDSNMGPRDVVAQLSRVRFINPIDESTLPPSNPQLRRPRIQLPVELEVDSWRIAGLLHLVDRVLWSDFLLGARGRFIPLSRASAQLTGSRSPVVSPFLIINGSRISALYMDPAEATR